MGTQEETGQVTGTKDKDYNVIWFVEQCLSNVLRLETYIEAGCQRFMLQFTDYDNLEPIEAWAADNLKRFR